MHCGPIILRCKGRRQRAVKARQQIENCEIGGFCDLPASNFVLSLRVRVNNSISKVHLVRSTSAAESDYWHITPHTTTHVRGSSVKLQLRICILLSSSKSSSSLAKMPTWLYYTCSSDLGRPCCCCINRPVCLQKCCVSNIFPRRSCRLVAKSRPNIQGL